MKFAQVLTGTLVQEWQTKYVDYDDGKKRIRVIEKLRSRLDSTLLGLDRAHIAYPEYEIEALSTNYSPLDSRLSRIKSLSPPLTLSSLVQPSANKSPRLNDRHAFTPNKSSIHKRSASTSVVESFAPVTESQDQNIELEELRSEQARFFSWFVEQLEMVDDFYNKTEVSLHERTVSISAQLHEMKFSLEDKRNNGVETKLKMALQELYRSIELLRSYSQLNRTAFGKILKKYTKAVQGDNPPARLTQALNNSSFVVSKFSKISLHTTEDLFAHYFQNGDRKIASSNLRRAIGNSSTYYSVIFRCGIYVALGTAMFVQGLIYAIEVISHHPNALIRAQASGLLQIYGGYFLALYLFVLFNVCCVVWQSSHVNYKFIFEFNPADRLDWRSLAEYPSFFFGLLGLTLFLNFSDAAPIEYFLYWPIVLIVVTTLIVFFPGRRFHYKSRRWWAVSHFRLLTAMLYQVEFRDIFLGDMYISLTYFTGNIPFFFCLYTQTNGPFSNPAQCGSSNSITIGFFAAVPAILRFLQCVKRYLDSGESFPHLVNGAKYLANIAVQATLSQFRIRQTQPALYAFIAASVINMLFATYWDLIMDWHLFQGGSKTLFLRDIRGFRPLFGYYLAILLDPILRSSWIFFIFFSRDARISFLVAFIEATRRGMWMLFRVENEHCTNISKLKTIRDIPLPYDLSSDSAKAERRKEFVKSKKQREEEMERQVNGLDRRSSTASSVWTTSTASTRSSSISSRASVDTTNSRSDLMKGGRSIA